MVLAVLAISTLVIQLAGPEADQCLRYEREAILDGQIWRLVTGHLVHLSWLHWLLNVAALFLLLLGLGARPRYLSVNLLFLAVAVSLELLLFDPALDWYVGLSGVLHGLTVLVAFWLWPSARLAAAGVFAGVVAKVAWEQLAGADPDLARRIGGEVIVGAHLYGLLSGIACALAVSAANRIRSRAASVVGQRL